MEVYSSINPTHGEISNRLASDLDFTKHPFYLLYLKNTWMEKTYIQSISINTTQKLGIALVNSTTALSYELLYNTEVSSSFSINNYLNKLDNLSILIKPLEEISEFISPKTVLYIEGVQ